MVSKVNDLKKRVKKIMTLAATPRKIAVGVAIAIFWNFIPSLGVGPVLTLIATKILKGNVVAAVTLNLGTSFFIPLFYTLNVLTGRVVMGRNEIPYEGAEKYTGKVGGFSFERLREIITTPEEFIEVAQGLSTDFVIGSVINAFLAGMFLYFTFLFLLKRRASVRGKEIKNNE